MSSALNWVVLTCLIVVTGACTPAPPARAAIGAEGQAGALHVDRVVSWGLPAAASLTVGFRVRNGGTEPDTLLGVSATAGQAMLHDVREGRMIHLTSIALPPGDELVLGTGGPHVMLDGVLLSTWDSAVVDVVLHFSRAGTLPLRVPIVTFTDAIRELRQ
jgi:copper(I)-binding protein